MCRHNLPAEADASFTHSGEGGADVQIKRRSRGGAVAVGAGAGAVSASPAESLLNGFAGYLRDERGLAELMVAAYLPDVCRFLSRRRDCDVGGLTAAEVSKAVLGEVASRSPASVRRYGCACVLGPRATNLGSGYPVRITTASGPISGTTSNYLLQIYPAGSNPDTATPLYQASGDLIGGQVVVHG